MGMEEGLTQAVGQIDAILAEDAVRRDGVVGPGPAMTFPTASGPQHHETDDGSTMTEPTTRTLEVPGATLTYDVRRTTPRTEPPLFLIGSPMGAAGFATLASHFPDRTVVTYDPRGAERSTKADPASPSTPELHADDLHRIIEEVGWGRSTCSPAAVARSTRSRSSPRTPTTCGRSSPTSRRWRRSCRTASTRSAAVRAISDDVPGAGAGAPAWRTSSRSSSHQGEFPAGFATSPARTRRCSACRPEDDGTRTDVMLGQNIVTCTHYEPDFDALRRGTDADRDRRRRRRRRASWRTAGRGGRRAARQPSPSSSRAITAGSWAASTAAGRARRVRRQAARDPGGLIGMGRLIYSLNVSLDGFAAAPDGGLAWGTVDEELHTWFNDRASGMDASLYGRRMYELMSGYWPTAAEDPAATDVERTFARIWNALPKFVFSTTLDHVDHNARLVRGDVGTVLHQVRDEFEGDLEVEDHARRPVRPARAGRRVPARRASGRAGDRHPVLAPARRTAAPQARRDARLRLRGPTAGVRAGVADRGRYAQVAMTSISIRPPMARPEAPKALRAGKCPGKCST